MVTSDPLVLTNVVTSTAIVLRLMMFRKPGGRHNWWASWLAYLIILLMPRCRSVSFLISISMFTGPPC